MNKLLNIIFINFRLRLTLFVIFLLFSGCRFTHNIIEEGKIILVQGDIGFSIIESYRTTDTVSKPEFLLAMSTKRIFGMLGYKIVFDCDIIKNSIFVRIRGIWNPGMGPAALGPADGQHFLKIKEGSYYLHFSYFDKTDDYGINISNSEIRIVEFGHSKFTQAGVSPFLRYPENSFVFLCRLKEKDSWVYSDFLDSLKIKFDLNEFHFPECGEIPYYTPEPYDDFMTPKYFYYEDENTFEKTGDFLKSYSENILNSLPGSNLILTNWMNKKYRSGDFKK